MLAARPFLALPALADALRDQGLVIDSVAVNTLRFHVPRQSIGGSWAILTRMQAGDFVAERLDGGIRIRCIPAFSRLCVAATAIGVTAFSVIPGALAERLTVALWLGAGALALQYACAASTLPGVVVRAADTALRNADSAFACDDRLSHER